MSKGKRVFLFILIVLNLLGWGNLLIRWYNTTNISIETLPDIQEKKSQEVIGVEAVLYPIAFDPVSKTFEFIANLRVPYNSKVDTNRFGLLGIYYGKGEMRQSPNCIEPYGCSGGGRGGGSVILPSVSLNNKGWYPFEEYHGVFVVNVDFDNNSITLPAKLETKDNNYYSASQVDIYSQFKIHSKENGNGVLFYISQPFDKKLLFVMVIILFIVFTIAVFIIADLSNLLQVSVALLVGLWGVKEILSPNDLPLSIRYGSEQAILYNYLFLGISICFWFFDKWATSQGWRLFELPTDEKEKFLNTGRGIYDETVIAPPTGINVQALPREIQHASSQIYWTSKEAADYLGISINKLNELARARKVFAIKDGGRWKYVVEDIKNWREK